MAGRHAKSLPASLAECYAEALADTDITSVRDELALADARIAELLTQIGGSGTTNLLQTIADKLAEIRRAGERGPSAVAMVRTTLVELDRIVSAGLCSATTWDELLRWVEQRRRLAETEARRLRALDVRRKEARKLINRLME